MCTSLRKAVLLASALVALFLGHGQSAQACTAIVTVKRGETLADIAKAHLGCIYRYDEIHAANRSAIGPDPDLLRIGLKLTIPCGAPAEAFDWGRLPDARLIEPLTRQAALQILDIRSTKAIEQSDGFIAGAISVPYQAWRDPKANSGQAPTDAELSALIGQHGLRLDKPIVVVGENGDPVSLGRAAYIYWILKSVGAERLAILRGGHASWVSEDLPLSNKPAEHADYRAEVQFADTWFARFDDIANIAVRNERGALLGAGDEMVYLRKAKGQLVQSPPQTMLNKSATEATNAMANSPDVEDGLLTILERLKAINVNWETWPVVMLSEAEELSALNWFSASELSGIRNVKLYPGQALSW